MSRIGKTRYWIDPQPPKRTTPRPLQVNRRDLFTCPPLDTLEKFAASVSQTLKEDGFIKITVFSYKRPPVPGYSFPQVGFNLNLFCSHPEKGVQRFALRDQPVVNLLGTLLHKLEKQLNQLLTITLLPGVQPEEILLLQFQSSAILEDMQNAFPNSMGISNITPHITVGIRTTK